jgi:predicted ATPase/DNA-binding NarL/FixJ family response regulator
MGAGGPPGRLRGELTEFVGRRAELALVRQALGSARMVTLTGPGGIGKTRLAVQAASGLQRAFRDGVWLAELGGLRDPGLLVPEVARSLGLSDRSVRWAVAALADYLQARQVLLVADQCEHLADACAVMADALLRACPGLRIMATSRHVLGVAGEVTVAVPPMTVPAGCQPAAPEELLRYEAVRLFTARAAAVLPGFTLDAENGATVAGICRALDGIPLAVELAAVRLRSLSPGQVLVRLGSRFQLLSGGGPAGQPHHRTLQAALEWSYGLLAGAERAMWRRVSVFAGSLDLDAAEAVCAGGEIAPGSVADLVDALVAKSILLRDRGHGGMVRYRLLDTIGEFGQQKLRAEGGEKALRTRHRDWYAALAARQEAFGRRRAEWITALNTDHENLRAALEFCLSEPSEVAAGAQLACDLWRYWETHAHLTEGRRILAAALERLDQAAAVRPQALWVAGYLAELQGDLREARTLLEAGIAAARSAGDVRTIAYASTYLGSVLFYLGERAQGHVVAETALRMHRESADQIGVALVLMAIGFIHLLAGEPQAAAGRFGDCARVCESSGNLWYHTYAQWGLATSMWLLGDHDGAATLASAALSTMRDLDDPIGVGLCLDTLAWVAAAQGQAPRAVTLLAAVDAAWSAIQNALANTLREQHDAALGAARAAMSEGAYRAASTKGAGMSQAEAIAYALGESRGPISRSGERPSESWLRLTPRERDVAALVARGLSNSQIAAALVISARTVETHVQHIMDRLGVSTRAQIAAWSAAESGQAGPSTGPPAGR